MQSSILGGALPHEGKIFWHLDFPGNRDCFLMCSGCYIKLYSGPYCFHGR